MATDRYTVVVDTKGAQQSLGRLGGSLKGVGALAAASFAVAGISTFAKQLLTVTKEYETMANKLKLVVSGNQDLVDTFSALQTVSNNTYTTLKETVDLYTNLKLATEALGKSSAEVTQVTKQFQIALAVSGADAGTAAGAIRQFGQAMASGQVRGDEFNSIVEALGPALAIMARESGTTVGELREMSRAGDLTAEVFFEMISGAEGLTKVFGSLDLTTEQLSVNLTGTFKEVLLTINEATGASGLYKNALISLNLTLAEFFGTSQSLAGLTPEELFGAVTEGTLKAEVALVKLRSQYTDTLGVMNLFGVLGATEREEINKQIAAIEELTASRKAEFEAAQEQLKADQEAQRVRSEMLKPLTDMGSELDKITAAYEKNIPQQQKLTTEYENVQDTLQRLLDLKGQEVALTPEYTAALDATKARLAQIREEMDGTAKSSTKLNREMANLSKTTKDLIGDLKQSTEDMRFEFESLNMTPLQRDIKEIERDIRTRVLKQIEKLQAAMTPENAAQITEQINQLKAAAESAINSQADLATQSYEHQRTFSFGWSQAFREYSENASNAANTAANIFDKTTRGIEDAIVNFAKTGKFSLKDMFSDVGETLLRTNIRNIIGKIGSSGPLSGLMSSLGIDAGTSSRGAAPNSPIFVADVTNADTTAQLGGMLGQFGNIASNIGNQMGRGSSSVVNTGSSGGSIFGDILSSIIPTGIKNIFSGFFANGGYIPAGNYGIVGERGPEMVMGPASVRPGVSGGGAMNVTINAVDAPSFQALVAADPEFIYSVAQRGSRSFS